MEYIRHDQWLTITIKQDYANQSVASFLQAFHIGRKAAAYWLDGRIMRRGLRLQPADVLQANDRLDIKAFEDQDVDYRPDGQPAQLVYRDDIIAVFNKPAGLIIYPDTTDGCGTLANMVAAYYLSHNIKAAVRPLHRLDQATSGLVVYSLSPFFQPLLDSMMAEKKIHRYYYALAVGEMKGSGRISAPIGKDRHDAKKRRVSPTGQSAVTEYQVIRSGKSTSLLKCTLLTGRTHQIRVHLAYIHHPVVNDPLYGSGIGPLGLQAYRLDLVSPLTGRPVSVEIPNILEEKGNQPE